MALTIEKAQKKKIALRAAMAGPPGSGKTYSALEVATHLVKLMIEKNPALESRKVKIALLDSERRTSERYADLFDYEIIDLHQSQSPDTYVEGLDVATDAGALVTITDSLSHAWSGKDGALAQVDKKSAQPGGSFNAWRDVTPMHNRLVDALLTHPAHLISTLRVKTEYAVEKDERGKTAVRKLGLAPVQREGLEYEFDVFGDLDQDNVWTITKTRCPPLRGQAIAKPGKKVAKILFDWLTTGAEQKEPTPPDASMIERMKEAFASININDLKLEAYLEHSLSALGAVEYAELRRIWKSVKDGHITWTEVFTKKHPHAKTSAPAAPPTTQLQEVKEAKKPPPTVDERSVGEQLADAMRAAKTLPELYAVRERVAKAYADRLLVVGQMTDLGSLETECDQKIRAAAAPPAADAAKEGAPPANDNQDPGTDGKKAASTPSGSGEQTASSAGSEAPGTLPATSGTGTPAASGTSTAGTAAASSAAPSPSSSASPAASSPAPTAATANGSGTPAPTSTSQTAKPASAATDTAPSGSVQTPAGQPATSRSNAPVLDRMNACKDKASLKALRKEIADMPAGDAKKVCQDLYNKLLKKLPEEVRA